MSEIDDLVKYFIDKDEVFTDGLFIDDPTEVLDDRHDAVEQLQNVGWRHVEASRGHYIDGRFFEVCKIDALNVEDRLSISFGQFYFTIEEFGSVFDEIGSEVSVDYAIATGRQEKYL